MTPRVSGRGVPGRGSGKERAPRAEVQEASSHLELDDGWDGGRAEEFGCFAEGVRSRASNLG